MNAFNPAHFRAQFPALADAGVYLDSAATALKPLAVIDASDQFYRLSVEQCPSQPVRRRPAADRALRGGPRSRGGVA